MTLNSGAFDDGDSGGGNGDNNDGGDTDGGDGDGDGGGMFCDFSFPRPTWQTSAKFHWPPTSPLRVSNFRLLPGHCCPGQGGTGIGKAAGTVVPTGSLVAHVPQMLNTTSSTYCFLFHLTHFL